MSICCVCQCTQLHTYLQQCWVSNERKPIFSIVRSVMEVQRCQTKKASNWCCVWLQLCDNFQLSSNMNRTPRWSLCMGWNVRKPIPKLYLLRKLFSSQLCSEYQTIWLRMSQSLGSANGHLTDLVNLCLRHLTVSTHQKCLLSGISHGQGLVGWNISQNVTRLASCVYDSCLRCEVIAPTDEYTLC